MRHTPVALLDPPGSGLRTPPIRRSIDLHPPPMAHTVEVYLHVGDLVLFPLVLLHLVLEQLTARLHEHVVVSRVELQLLLVQVDDVGAHT